MTSSPSDPRVHRVDKFSVPAAVRTQFLERVQATHVLLRTLPGFIQDAVLEQTEGPGRFNFVTIVTWADQNAVEAARVVVAARHRAAGFNLQDTIARLGIAADLGFYRDVARELR